jgi:hypothetical protein
MARNVNNYNFGVANSDNNEHYIDANDKAQQYYKGYQENYQLNNDRMTIEMIVDYVQADLTFSGLMPKVLPDGEILRMKSYYHLDKHFLKHEQYSQLGYIIMPEEVENIVRITEINDPSLFRIGIQAPNLSINFGVTNQPYLTSFVTNVGELGVYRQILSAFSDEINKMSRNYTKYSYNPVNHRLHILDEARCNMMLEVYVRIEQEEVFNNQLFKDLVVSYSRTRLGEALGRMSFNMPGNFQYNASDLISQGEALLLKTEEAVKATSPNSSFFIMKR